MQLRSQKQYKMVEEEIQKEISTGMESVAFLHPVDEKEQSLSDLEEAILMLSKEQRICIELFYLKRKSYLEIVQITGEPYQQVKSHIQNGKRNLKILLEGHHER